MFVFNHKFYKEQWCPWSRGGYFFEIRYEQTAFLSRQFGTSFNSLTYHRSTAVYFVLSPRVSKIGK